MTPEQLRELIEGVRRGEPIGLTRAVEIMQGYANALEEVRNLRLLLSDKNADISAMGASRVKADAAHAAALDEIKRLNKWADGMTDAALKERKTGEEYQRELRQEVERLKVKLNCTEMDRDHARLDAKEAERRAERLEVYAEAAMSWIEDKHPDEAKQYLPDFVDAYRADKGG